MRLGWLTLLIPLLIACSSATTVPRERATGASPNGTSAPIGTTLTVESGEIDRSQLPATARGWATDWSRRTIPLDELMSGGPPRDGIPPIDAPRFELVLESDWLEDGQPLLLFEHDGVARGYPLAILIWHEVVNDIVAGKAVAVTYCPLCNTALVFDRDVDGTRLDFGTSGLLRYSDLVMWDRQTETLWQQATGEGIVGAYAGTRLTLLPASLISVGEFRAAFPNGELLARPEGGLSRYGQNPYENYDSSERPFLFTGTTDDRLPALERVVGLVIDDEAVAYPFSTLAEARVINDEVAGRPVVLFFSSEARSALDQSRIAESRMVGSAIPYDPIVAGRRLTFRADAAGFVDEATGSRWDITGRARSGPLKGHGLTPLPHANHFWFAFQAFYDEIRLWSAK